MGGQWCGQQAAPNPGLLTPAHRLGGEWPRLVGGNEGGPRDGAMAGIPPVYPGEGPLLRPDQGSLRLAALWAQPGHQPAACQALGDASE